MNLGPWIPALTLVGAVALPAHLAAQAAEAGSITGVEARDHVGATVTVCGPVASTRYDPAADGRPTFLNLDHPYPSQSLVVVIPGTLRSSFDRPEVTLANARICATGVVEELQAPAGLFRIVITGGEKLVVLDDHGSEVAR